MTRAEDVTRTREDVGRVPRRRGVVNGFLVVLLGLWGATVPFFGPYLGLPYGFDDAWVFTGERALLNVLPGVVVVLGGLGLIGSARSTGGVFWGWLAAVGGAWFILGPTVSTMWTGGAPAVGEPLAASAGGRAVTELVYHLGLGALIVFLAAVALGRFTAGTGRTVVAEVPEQDRGLHATDSTTDRLRTRTEHAPTDRPHSDHVHGDNLHSDNLRGDNPHSDNVRGDRLHTDTPHGDRPQTDRPAETTVLHRPAGPTRDDVYNQGAYDQGARDAGRHHVPDQPR